MCGNKYTSSHNINKLRAVLEKMQKTELKAMSCSEIKLRQLEEENRYGGRGDSYEVLSSKRSSSRGESYNFFSCACLHGRETFLVAHSTYHLPLLAFLQRNACDLYGGGAKNSIPAWGRTESGYICGKEKTWRLASGRVDDPVKRCQERLTSERSTRR
ncbi:hypothetical protein LAZ67_18000442 [Cordylochernes scorpioides]|uniref:Uncharacterized protein n=1 Tax=Cordylochernes scorpioides TaxID=51811 RepID=A0ABY6LEW5_9ARAC|nr:hypothetical protein LAZ67_18000442 [Cordylochernes scorpioides]